MRGQPASRAIAQWQRDFLPDLELSTPNQLAHRLLQALPKDG